ncbi:MAG: TonB-dependent receptor plug domain-containing protein [Allosphingosinicella sp.]|uniref:TonB-dependent receptor plug domain-containing protein n=1 Tax=Allosphingosinicella sp. TaxID=2823234 RepID=UPI0039239092
MIVTTRRELEEGGVSDLAGFTRTLPQNFTGGTNPGIAGGGQQGGQSNINNSAALNLRGLGPDATLTLVNGHRLAYDALNQGVDISAIPLAAVERIEVIADGASALYGSDAVGGVANIILRRAYDGLQTTARIGASTEGGNVQQQYSAVTGGRWRSGGAMLALDHNRTTPILAGDRHYASSLFPTTTLTLRSAQSSGVLSGHQRITGGVVLEIDAIAMQRKSQKRSPFLSNADLFTNGLATDPTVRSFALAPTVRIDLPARWQAALSATRAVSHTRIYTSRYQNNVPFNSRLIYENRLSGIEASAEGPLFPAPGGDARLAIGGGLRTVALHLDITDFINGNSVTFRNWTEKRDVQFGYGEFSLPLIGPELAFPLIERLTLSAAVRYERWEEIDDVATPRFGMVYQPHRDVLFRASWGKAFKVPTLNQVNQVLQGALLPGTLFAPQPQPPLPAGATVLYLGGGNPDLRSERATTWSTAMELRPAFLPGLRLDASYFNIDYRDRIGTALSGTLSSLANPIFRDLITFNPSIAQVTAIIATLPQGLSNQTGRPFNPASVAAIINGTLGNTARERVRGVDLVGEYRIGQSEDDRLLLTAAASYLKSDRQLARNQPVFQRAGTIFNPPNWRARGGIVWQGRQAGLALLGNYVGSTRDVRFPIVERVGPFVTVDLSASWRSTAPTGPLRGVELRLSVINMLNEEPDTIRNTDQAAPPYDSTNQSPVGRFVGLAVRKDW